jgi:hypothetical protein
VTLNEAADMEVYFRQKISEDPLPSKIKLMLRRESESDSTLSNIDHFFKTLPASTQGHIYIVSSLFHLPRFIDLTTARIVEKKLSIAQLTFASAEDPWKPHTAAVREVDYLKSCMYEFFLLLYRAHQAEKLFQPVTQNF